jgi:hypothetical protein
MIVRTPARQRLGFELRGLDLRLIYDDARLALDRQPSVRAHADVAPLLARLFEDPSAGLLAALVNDNRRLFAVARLDARRQARKAITPSAVYRAVIVSGARAVYLAHRHAGAAPEPSEDDVASAARVYAIGYELGLELCDSLIFGPDGRYISLRERGEGAEDWRRERERHDPDYPRGHMRLHQATVNRRPERPSTNRSASARAALWLCPTCHRRQNYKRACRYCDTPRPEQP